MPPRAVHQPPVRGHPAGIGAGQAGDDVEQRRLAAAARSDQANEFAVADPQVDVVERMDAGAPRPEPFGNALDAAGMFAVDEATAAAVPDALERGGELSAVAELRRYFPLITDGAQARTCVRTIATWRQLPPANRISRRHRLPRRDG